ncbi:uncharacterized protein LDX57_008627 [Aspergillus melleus]|uniref:uncharacterized protein n=1 Tax=Aspergillus melleus TaxID=138277 RepID=UPI001E8DACFF|nr:uncharacterized protein LDX57_008627 [Aspergillus melleus]KAH8430965.1 hypothetical protein LDX57_008627 [Aspergillus melleus]
MSVLAYESPYMLVYKYVYACPQALGKALHAWKLQYLLYGLSMDGNENERLVYTGLPFEP